MEELTVSSAEHVARRLSSKGEKSMSVTRSDREEGKTNGKQISDLDHSCLA